MKKVLTMLMSMLLSTACLFSLVGCTAYRRMQEREILLNQIDYSQRSIYVNEMYFMSTVGSGWAAMNRAFSVEENTRCIFVYSEAESEGYPDDVVVAWPTEDTERVLYCLNNHIEEADIDLDWVNLTHPITMTDVVERWDSVNDLISSLGSETRKEVLDPAKAPW